MHFSDCHCVRTRLGHRNRKGRHSCSSPRGPLLVAQMGFRECVSGHCSTTTDPIRWLCEGFLTCPVWFFVLNSLSGLQRCRARVSTWHWRLLGRRRFTQRGIRRYYQFHCPSKNVISILQIFQNKHWTRRKSLILLLSLYVYCIM